MSDFSIDTLTEVNKQQQIRLAWAARHHDVAVPDGNAVTVLLVDDDKIDRMVVRRAFNALNITNPIVEAGNGIKALDMLRGHNGCEKMQQPYIVLLDLHMPRMDGIEFLEEAFGDPALQPMLVFVLTTSAADEQWVAAHARNIAGYVPTDAPEQSVLMAISMATNSRRAVGQPN